MQIHQPREPHSVFPHLTVVLLAPGITWDIYKELLISLVSFFFMGFRVLFLLLWVDIYI
ncbi:unnamed protein product [Nyctereutes procyonoides]|uniref:Dolichyl-diphosphooligosaccharide--protein glycosyltransferase subunit TMEM258 n=1 Tax=Nyctereutes procyonoides TaxID=34880 RepID=A0A811ZC20_NYCPR|nr:unnamed protein product [Nyctereutes procyonoides]